MSTQDDTGTPPLPTPAVAAPAPAPAPADQAAGQTKPTDPPVVDPNAITPFEYEAIEGDPGLTMALQFIGKQGLGPDSPEVKAALNGDFSFLKATLASRGTTAAGFEHFLALAEKSWDKHVAETAAAQTKTAETIHAAVGGKESWEAIQKWAGENADDGEKQAINAMLNAGGFQARAAATLLQSMYANASGTVVEPAAAVGVTPANAAAPSNGAALSPADFTAEVAKLVASMGPVAAGKSKEMEALRNRRAAHRG